MTQHMTLPVESKRLAENELKQIDAYWRAANYLTVGQIYLLDNPLLREPLRIEHVKPRLLGHWGTSPGLSFIYAHLNRVIRMRDANLIYVCGPGHGGPAMVANTYLEGTYTELNPDITLDESGMRKLFRQFSFPGGIPSHAAPDVPGSIHEGGELGYSLSHAFGAAFDNPDLIVACVVGDGEAETGPLAAAWHSNKFLNPARDGAVLPILHLNGYKIANPTILARIPDDELRSLFAGYGYEPLFVEGDEPAAMHERMAKVLDDAIDRIRSIQDAARSGNAEPIRPPEMADDRPAQPEGLDRAEGGRRAQDRRVLALASGTACRPGGEPRPFEAAGGLADAATVRRSCSTPQARRSPRSSRPRRPGARRMSANPHANGGLLRKSLEMPDLRRPCCRRSAARAPSRRKRRR